MQEDIHALLTHKGLSDGARVTIILRRHFSNGGPASVEVKRLADIRGLPLSIINDHLKEDYNLVVPAAQAVKMPAAPPQGNKLIRMFVYWYDKMRTKFGSSAPDPKLRIVMKSLLKEHKEADLKKFVDAFFLTIQNQAHARASRFYAKVKQRPEGVRKSIT